MTERVYSIHVRLREPEYVWLKERAEREERSPGTLLALMVRQQHEGIGLPPIPAEPERPFRAERAYFTAALIILVGLIAVVALELAR